MHGCADASASPQQWATTRVPHACWERLVDVGADFSSVVSHSMQLRVAAHFILKIHKDFERARGVENELQK